MSLGKSPTDIVVITDTSCLIIFEKLSLLNLLPQLFARVLITTEIANEYTYELPEWIDVLPVQNRDFQQQLSLLVDAGEASAIALAHEIYHNYLVTDDFEARKLALEFKLPVIGSLGVLLRAKEAGLIELIKPLLDQIRETNFRMSAELYQTVLAKAGEM